MRYLLIAFFSFHQIAQAQSLAPANFGLKASPLQICTPVKDQYLSSTCWSFASLSFLESELIKKGKADFDLSEMFIVRYSLLRKIALHLKLKGKNFFTPGGQFHDVVWVINNHGIMPESAYPGKKEFTMHNHAALDTLLSRYVKQQVAEGVTELNVQQQIFIDSVLDHYLGKVPGEFMYDGNVYTPFSFRDRVIELNMDDYVEITSYNHHPFYYSFSLEDKYNWTNDTYMNVSAADFSAIINNALLNDYTVGWIGDADDKDFHHSSGLAWLGQPVSNYQAERQKDFETQVTSLNHVMHIVKTETDNKGRLWYYVKNSWGDYSNALGGFLFMQEDYFKLRTVAIVVNKTAIPEDIHKKLNY
jgi:bleomycin hydrolase